MDFVVFGFGLGAILMLVGFALRDLGPWLFGATRDDEALPEFEGVRTTIRKQILSSISNAISVAGAGVATVTFAALLAKAEDDLGAIVVGMALVLATIGAGAWSYDVFRRYRAAMDIVAAQEQSVRLRLAPRPKRRRPQPAPAEQPAGQPAGDHLTVEKPAIAASATMDPADQDQPQADDERSAERNAGNPAHAQKEVAPSNHVDAADDLSSSPDDAQVDREDEEFFANLEFHPETRMSSPAREIRPVTDKPESVELPPLPEEPDDELIDESVRFEPRPEQKRTVPSWLFEDLESDLASTGPGQSGEPIDQFHDATPMPRASALDRLLADEESTGSQPGDAPNHQSRRRPPNRPTPRDDD